MTGTAGQKRVPTEFMRSALMPVPEIETQRRIVKRIDALFSELDDGEEDLRRARSELETYRKSLLKAAVTGELTADWRAANPPKETGADLLQRILTDRRARWEADPKNKGKRYKEPSGVDVLRLPELPDGWVWATFDQLVGNIEAGLNVKAIGRPPEAHETGIVKISAVTWDDFDELQSKTLLPNAAVDERDLIHIGDLLISRANTLELVGAPSIVGPITRRLVLSDKVLRLVIDARVKTWAYYLLKSPLGRAQIEGAATGNQLSMRNISQDSLRRLAMPLPGEAELHQVLDFVSNGWLTHAELRDSVADADSATLRQSILAAAFRGELVQ